MYSGGDMKRRFSSLARVAAAFVAAIALAAPAAQGQSSRPTVAILDLEFGAVQKWWEGNWDIGKGVADLVVDGLVEDGSYRVIERKKLDAILAEQNFSNSDRADPGAKTVAQLGKALGVKYLLVGSITKFGTENKNLGVGGGGFGRLGGALGSVGTKKGKATVALAIRVIDTSTGEIMASAKGEGESKRSGLMLGGGGAGTGGGGFGGINMGSSDFRETILGEATEAAVKMTVEKLVAAKGRITNP
jgi:curli biogenesis system outer membrane secretion channel CsgG